MKVLKIYTDGGARGNPGPAAAAFVVIDNEKVIHKDSKFLGKKTNNEAEYEALLMALEWLNVNKSSIGDLELCFYLDSELIVRQLKGLYKVKSRNLKPLASKALLLTSKIGNKVEFISVRRENNKLADSLVNKQLDKVIRS